MIDYFFSLHIPYKKKNNDNSNKNKNKNRKRIEEADKIANSVS
jgi:hypothetical protein